MKSSISRRDFLKITGLVPVGLGSRPLLKTLNGVLSPRGQGNNVLVVVFDALSAYNVSLYGYRRETMPNLARLAKRAVVYHNHFAGANYTTPGTASLLTGTYPWSHRALQPNNQVAGRFATSNLFSVFQGFHRVAYTHNPWANTLLRQMRREIDELIPRERLLLRSYDNLTGSLFGSDEDIASVSWTRGMKMGDDGYAYSLFLSHLYQVLEAGNLPGDLRHLFPRGLPTSGSDSGFLLEQAIDWLSNLLTRIDQPFLGYFHFLPPHSPYHTSLEFFDHFKGDGYEAVRKPVDELAQGEGRSLQLPRREYDEYILYADREFGRFYDALEAAGLLNNTWLIFTSDHGEMFERGFLGHDNPSLYQPVIRIPLLIFEPGRAAGMDIHSPTSGVDVLPTLAYLTGHPIPDWTEGVLLPPYAPARPDPDRSVYAVQARENAQYGPLTRASTMLVKGRDKLLYFFGYRERGIDALVKLYDIQDDPEELVDLSSARPQVAAELLGELKSKLARVNQPYL